MCQEKAFAKLNLTLDVLGKREDGYHDLCMIMETVNLADTLTFSREGEGLRVKSNLDFLPEDGGNLAAAAARVFDEYTGLPVEPMTITIEKNIPVCAGMAGGSSDAAAVLRYLNRSLNAGLSDAQLQKLGERVGSDVPYCVTGGTAVAEGRGERLTPLTPLPKCRFVLCKPSFSISTPALFHQLDSKKIRRRPDTAGLLAALEQGDLPGVARRLYNVFENVLPDRQHRQVEEIKALLLGEGALGVAMSGTGPTVYGIFDDLRLAENGYAVCRDQFEDTFLVQNV